MDIINPCPVRGEIKLEAEAREAAAAELIKAVEAAAREAVAKEEAALERSR
jgi:hypothetical protein